MSAPKKVGIIGGGRMGSLRYELIKTTPELTLVGLVEPNHSLAVTWTSKGVKVFENVNDLLELVDGVFICTHTASHPSLIEAAAKAKRHIHCEKPIAFTYEEIERCYQICKENKVHLHAGWMKRFDPKFTQAKQTLGQDPWFHIRMVNRDNPMPSKELLRNMGDLFSDCGIHEYNLALWFAEELPIAVTARGISAYDTGVIDMTFTTLEFSGGRIVTVENSRYSPEDGGYDQRVEVMSKRRKIVVQDQDNERYHSFPDRYHDAFKAEVAYFAKLLQDPERIPVQCPPEHCKWVSKIAASALESHYSGRRVLLKQSLKTPDGKKIVNLRFLGHGKFGKSIYDIVNGKVKQFQLLEPVTATHLNFEKDIIEDSNTEAVYICTPDAQHHVQALRCLESGKPVLVEKPVLNYESVYLQAFSSCQVLMVGFQRRFATEFLRAKHHLDSREFNTIKSIIFRAADPVPASEDTIGNVEERVQVIRNSLCHDLDCLNWLFPKAQIVLKKVIPQAHSGVHILLSITQSGVTIDAQIQFQKDFKTYVQQVIIDDQVFGYDFAPIANDPREVWVQLYEQAYADQFNYFHSLVSGDTVNLGLASSYRRSFLLLEEATQLARS